MTASTLHDTTTDDPEIVSTPSGWLAIANDYPHIAVLASSRDEAADALASRQAWWRAVDDRDPNG